MSQRFLVWVSLLGFSSLARGLEDCVFLRDDPPKWELTNPWVQSFQLNGRMHWQTSYVSGSDADGAGFRDSDDEYRRFRLGARLRLLEHLRLHVAANLVSDHRKTGGELDWGYQNFDVASTTLDLNSLFELAALDNLQLSYGRHKLQLSEESRMSSNAIYTIERSALSNGLSRSARPTGVTIELEKGDWSAAFGVFSAETGSDSLDGWGNGQAFYGRVQFQLNEEWRLLGDLLVNDPKTVGVDRFGYDWAGSLNAVWERDAAGIASTLAYGENQDSTNAARGGSFYGVMVMPWYWVQKETLQAVIQYQFAGASRPEGFRLGSRYVRASEQALLNRGYGDALHTVYAGLNYHLCGQAVKWMGGVEYTHLATPAGTVEAWSYLMAVRLSF